MPPRAIRRHATDSTAFRMGCALLIGASIWGLGALYEMGRPPSPTFAGDTCWIGADRSGLSPLDEVENLETCGARLEVMYLRGHKPVQGAYGGMLIYVDAHGIDAAAPNGPRGPLITQKDRREIDADIVKLIALQQLKREPLPEGVWAAPWVRPHA